MAIQALCFASVPRSSPEPHCASVHTSVPPVVVGQLSPLPPPSSLLPPPPPCQVVRTVLSNRLARVQGLLFRATFLRDVPLFSRLIAENLLLCLAHSLLFSSSRFLTASLGLQWRSILTSHIHQNYFKVNDPTGEEME